MTSFRSFQELLVPTMVALQGAAVVAFIAFGRRADAAMDKSGMGNYHLFSIWDQRAGWAFIAFVALWAATSTVLIARHGPRLMGMRLLSRPVLALWLVPTVGAIATVVSIAWV